MNVLPWFFSLLVAIPVLGIPATTLAMVYRGARSNGASRSAATWCIVLSAVGAALWGAMLWWVAASGAFTRITVLVPIATTVSLLVALAWARIPVVTASLHAPGAASALIAPQTLRIAGVVFLLAMVLGRLPWVFALPAGIGDIAVGITAPFAIRRSARGAVVGAVWFNVLGLFDLVVALTLGALSGLSDATQLIPTTPSSAELTMLPLVLVPTAAVPLAIALHILDLAALRRLAHRGRAGSGQGTGRLRPDASLGARSALD